MIDRPDQQETIFRRGERRNSGPAQRRHRFRRQGRAWRRPPGAQQILRIRKTIDEDGKTTVSRTSLLGGRTFRFMTLVTAK